MGTICLEGIEFYSYHGCFKEERIVGSRFIVDVFIETDITKASETDDFHDALDYQHVYDLVKKEMEINSHLLENITGRIIDALNNNFNSIEKVTVKVSKVNPPVRGKMDKVSIILSK